MMLPKFYPIVDHPDWVARLLPLGVKMLQLRMKAQPDKVVCEAIARAKVLCAQYGAILVVNDYWQWAVAAQVEWIHLGQEDLDTADVAWIRRHQVKLGISTHDDAELERALSLAPDYVALGPVYPTTSKPMRWHEQGLDKVSVWKQRIGKIPLVAIGGMTVERASGAYQAGADVISVISDVTKHPQPEERVRAWLEVAR